MAKKGDPKVLRYVVRSLRLRTDMTQAAFGQACGIDQSSVSRFETGEDAPSEDILRRMARVAGVAWPLVLHLQRFFAAFVAALGLPESGAGGQLAEAGLLEPVRLALSPHLLEEASLQDRNLEDERREAEAICTALRSFPAAQRRRLLAATVRASRSPVLAVELCEESVRAAADEPAEALAWAELALTIADQVENVRDRARLQAMPEASAPMHCACSKSTTQRPKRLRGRGLPGRPGPAPSRTCSPSGGCSTSKPRCAASSTGSRRPWSCSSVPAPAAPPVRPPKAAFCSRKSTSWRSWMISRGAARRSGGSSPLIRRRRRTPASLCSALQLGRRPIPPGALQRGGRPAAAGSGAGGRAGEQARPRPPAVAGRPGWRPAWGGAGAVASLEQVPAGLHRTRVPYDAALSSLDLAFSGSEGAGGVRELAGAWTWIFTAKASSRRRPWLLCIFSEEAARHDRATAGLARQVIAEIEERRPDGAAAFEEGRPEGVAGAAAVRVEDAARVRCAQASTGRSDR